MKKRIIILLACLTLATAAYSQEKLENLTLEAAVKLALAGHPELEAARQEILVSKGRRTQAGLLSNPALILGSEALNPAEGLASEGNFITGIRQEIPIFGSMTKNKRLAEKMINLKEKDQQIAILEIENKVISSFASALFWDKTLTIVEEIVRDSQQEFEISKARLAEGDITPGELARHEIALAEARVELEEIRSKRLAAFENLKVAMGNSEIQISSLSGDLIHPDRIPALNDLLLNINQHPYLQKSNAEADVTTANLDRVRNSMFPNLELEFKHRRVNEIEESRYDFGLSFSLPVFDRKQGEREAAAAEVKLTQSRNTGRRNALIATLRSAHGELTKANNSLAILMNSTLAKAGTEFKMASAQFEEGDISLVEFLPHKREFLKIKLQVLMGQRDVLLAWADIYPFIR